MSPTWDDNDSDPVYYWDSPAPTGDDYSWDNPAPSSGGSSDAVVSNVLPKKTSKMQSNAIFRCVDLICEGEIEGLVNGDKSVYLNGVQLQGDDDSYNFENVSFSYKYGTADQTYIKDFNQVETPVTSGFPVELTYAPGNPEYVIKTITNTDVDAVRITIRLPSLFWLKKDGDYKSTKCTVRVDVQCNGGGYQSIVANKGAFFFDGLTKSQYERSVTIDLKSLGDAPYDLRVWRKSRDSDDKLEDNSKTYWVSYTEIINVKLTYPNSAIFGLEVDARSMGGKVPKRIYHLRGRKIKVPINYTPYLTATYVSSNSFTVSGDKRTTFLASSSFCCNCGDDGYMECEVDSDPVYSAGLTTVTLTTESDTLTSNLVSAERVYSGTWNGRFYTTKKWSSNSAWVFYDLLNESFACAGISAAYIDKWTLYSIAQYCDILVDNGYGKKEPRFSFNGKIDKQYDAQELFNVLAASFNAMPYWGSAIATISQDKPTDATRLYTNANVVNGEFFYDGTGLEDIHTAAVVVWDNPVELGRAVPEYIQHAYGIERYGYNEKRVSTLGCISKGQAHRIGKWLLDSEVFKPDTVRFRASFDSIDLYPGEVIKVADQYYGDKRFGFRVMGALGINIFVEGSFTKEVAETYSLHVLIRNSDDEAVIESKSISAAVDWGSAFGSELITNGDMEFDSNWDNYGGSTDEQSTEQKYSGSYGWKIVAGGANQGIESSTYTTISGTIYRYTFYVYPLVASSVRVTVADGIDSGTIYSNTFTDLTLNAWNKIEFEATETQTGALAYVRIFSVVAQTFYIDSVSCKSVTESNNARLVIDSVFSRDPIANEMAVISQADDLENNVREFRVIAAEEVEKNKFDVFGIEYDADKFARMEGDIEFEEPIVPPKNLLISPPTNLDIVEFTYKEGQNHLFGINVTWTLPEDPRVIYYTVQFEKDSDADDPSGYVTVARIEDSFYQIKPLDISGTGTLTYTVRVRSEALTGHSTWVYDDIELSLDPSAPPDVTGLQVKGGGSTFTGFDCEIEWDDMSSPITNPRHNDYKVEIYDVTPTLLRTEYITVPNFIYTLAMNIEDNTTPNDDLTFKVYCRDIYSTDSDNAAELAVSNADPTNPQNLTSSSWSLSVEFSWDRNTESDFSHYEYRAKVGAVLNGESWFEVQNPFYTRVLTSDEKDTYGSGATIYFEVIAVDVFSNESSVSSTNDTAASLNILPTDIVTFGPAASKLFPYSPVISGLTVTDSSPFIGHIAWSSFTLWHNNIEYSIAAGYTEDFYVYWKDLATTLSTSVESSNPLDLSDWTPLEDSVILINESGVHQKAWGNAICNQIIGSAQIMKLAVGDAHVETLSGTKITANTIAASRLEGDNFGTLTITSGKIAINTTDALEIQASGNMKLLDGSDIICEAGGDIELHSTTGGDTAQIEFHGNARTYYMGVDYDNDYLCIYPDSDSYGSLFIGANPLGNSINFATVWTKADSNILMYCGNTSFNMAPTTLQMYASTGILLNSTLVSVSGDFAPTLNGGSDLGTSSYRWNDLLVNEIDLNGDLDMDGGLFRLDVDANDGVFAARIRNTRSDNANNVLWLDISAFSPDNTASKFIYAEDNTESKFIVYSSGDVVNRNDSYGSFSDISLKENVVDCTPKLSDLLSCQVRHYNLKTKTQNDKHIGLVSQELENIFPGLVGEGEGLKYIKYSLFIPMLIKALQEVFNDYIIPMEKDIEKLKV